MTRHGFSLGALGVGVALVGCNAILGIEDRHLPTDSQGGLPNEPRAGAPAAADGGDDSGGHDSGGGGSGGGGGDAGNGGGPNLECLPDADATRTGVVQVDGYLDAADAMSSEVLALEDDFQARIVAMAVSLGVDASGGYSSQVLDEVLAAIADEVAMNTELGASVFLSPPQCSADIEAALEHQKACEQAAGCDTSNGATDVLCAGICEGECSGSCDRCAGDEPSCEAKCIGACELPVAAACSGQCQGSCSGTCSARDDLDQCAGACDGLCSGTCELHAGADCAGTCLGTCLPTSCGAGSTCAGHCEDVCVGTCNGLAIPLAGDPACDSAFTCSDQSSLLGAAYLTCAPTAQIAYDLKASIGAGAAAQFRTRMDAVMANVPAIVGGQARLEVITAGQLAGEVIATPAPYAVLVSALGDLADRADRGLPIVGVPEGCETAVAPFLTAPLQELDGVLTRGTTLAAAQLKFVNAVASGFE